MAMREGIGGPEVFMAMRENGWAGGFHGDKRENGWAGGFHSDERGNRWAVAAAPYWPLIQEIVIAAPSLKPRI
jgi:hypothetical protein